MMTVATRVVVFELSNPTEILFHYKLFYDISELTNEYKKFMGHIAFNMPINGKLLIELDPAIMTCKSRSHGKCRRLYWRVRCHFLNCNDSLSTSVMEEDIPDQRNVLGALIRRNTEMFGESERKGRMVHSDPPKQKKQKA